MTAKWPAFPQVDPLAAEDITDLGNTVLQGDLRSNAWDGGSDLSGGADSDASAGFYIDSSAGAAQFMAIHLTTGAIGTPELANGAVDTDKLADLAVEAAKLAGSSVTAAKIANLAVGTAAIATAAITTAKINDAAITTAKIQNAAITNAKISDLSADKINAGIITSLRYRTATPGNARLEIRADSQERFIRFIDAGDLTLGTMGQSTAPSGGDGLLLSIGPTDLELDDVGGIFANTPYLAPSGLTSIDGTSVPAYSFSGDRDSGMYLSASNVLAFRIGGTNSMTLSRISSEEYRMTFPTASATYISATRIGTTDRLKLEANDFINSGTIFGRTTGSAANQHINNDGDMLRVSSARKYKSRITYNVGYLADIAVKPAKFYRKDSGRWFYGLIADDLAEQDPLLADYDEDGQVENYDDRELLAVLASKVNRLEALVLEAT